MAPPPGTLRVGRYFLALLALLAVLYLIVFFPGKRHTPKLGLDLVGGQQVIFEARAPQGRAPSSSAMSQALEIMRDRVNGTGVTEAEVVQQGSDEIVVSIPGGTATDVAKLGAAAKLNFRGLVAPATPVTCGRATPSSSGSASPSGSASSGATGSPTTSKSPAGSNSSKAPNGFRERPLTAPTSPTATGKSSATPKASTSPSPATTPSTTPSAAAPKPAATCNLKSVAQLHKLVKLPAPNTVYKTNGVSDALAQSLQNALTNFDCSTSQDAPDPPNDYYLACDDTGTIAYLLGPVVVPGTEVESAVAQASTTSANWSVQLTLKSKGSNAWAKYTGDHNIGGSGDTTNFPPATSCSSAATPCADFVGFTLDGQVISAPVNTTAINGQPTSITGSFTQSSANDLAKQLKYGALPLTFRAQQSQTVSATLGTSQLKAGLLAGGIGLILVVIYSLIYYRALGLVTIASLLVSGGLTYAMLVILGSQIGFTLSLAGIAGFIVAVGITADSFVVFFERIKDEVHEGRSMRVAVPRAWIRARRTILSADTVSFLAAAVLYYFAAGDVKGFAFTLGLSTIIDLVVVFLFTHPIVSVLSRSRAFGSARFTGLANARTGGIVRAEDDPATRRRAAAAPAKRVRTGKPGPATVAEAPVAVLDDEAPDEPLTSDPDAAPEAPTAESDDTGADTTERRRTTPEGGSAAERAAARRARLREQGDTKGKS